MLAYLGYNIRKLFRLFSGHLKIVYWVDPASLEAEIFKKACAKRLSNKVKKGKQKSDNQKAKELYKYVK